MAAEATQSAAPVSVIRRLHGKSRDGENRGRDRKQGGVVRGDFVAKRGT